jgi:DNA-directed RNA polymerase sigma subunit (sigma70/sigma32)
MPVPLRGEPEEIARTATAMLEWLERVTSEIAHQRAEALRQLRSQGWTLNDIAGELGLTRQRIEQITRHDGK